MVNPHFCKQKIAGQYVRWPFLMMFLDISMMPQN